MVDSVGGVEGDGEGAGEEGLEDLDVGEGGNDEGVADLKLEALQVLGKGLGDGGLAIAFDVDVGDCGGGGVISVVEAEVPVAVTVEGDEAFEWKADFLLRFVEVRASDGGEVGADAGDQ